jgi:hypothetical protein
MQDSHLFKSRLKPVAIATFAAVLLGFGMSASRAADNLPDPGGAASEDAWKVDVFYENDTHGRKDVGLSKFRNTFQVEADKNLGGNGTFSSIKFRSKLRATYDGVYAMNKKDYGKKAGGPIQLETGDPGFQPVLPVPSLGLPFKSVPHGSGIISQGATAGALGLTTNTFTNGYPTALGAANGNDGLRVLGGHLHATAGGVAFGVPVRPCDIDRRGCTDFGGYGDKTQKDLEFPEFNNKADFIREAFLIAKMPLASGATWNFQLGKQQVVWGRTDLFRVLDVINPMDYSRNNIYDEMQDIRIPMWIATAEYRMGAGEVFEDNNIQFVWNFDKFRPHNLGQGGTPNQILDVGDFFRSMKNCWDNGCTVANFALARPDMPGYATNFGPGQLGIRQANLPEWSMRNTQFGVKWEGVLHGTSFSLNALTYRSQLPSLRNLPSKGVATNNPFTGQQGLWYPIIAFDVDYPRIQLLGASADLHAESIGSTFRLETALTHGEEFPNTARPSLYSESRVLRYVIGWDRPTFIPFLSTSRAFLISAQLFGQRLLDHELNKGPWGKVGMPDWEQNHIATLLVKGWFQNDMVSPQVLMAHDFQASATVVSPSVEWLVTDKLKFTFGANVKTGDGARKFDDTRSINPWAPFTGLQADRAGGPMATFNSLGLSGFEPLGRFRAGPIGMAQKEDEIFVTMRYKF